MAKKPTSVRDTKKVTFSTKKKRPGIHSKKKASRHKHGKYYLKRYSGQGR
jgi:hypothetical protein